MSKEFGETESPVIAIDPLTDAADLLLYFAERAKKPVILAMQPPQNDHGLKPGQMQGSSSTKLRPSCQGLVIAVSGSADDVQGLLDLVIQWKENRNG